MTGKKTEIVQKLYAAFQEGDLPTLLEHMTDRIDWGVAAQMPSAVPWYGTGTGKEYAAGFFKALARECDFTRFEPTEYLENENGVACLVRYDATLKRNGRMVSQEAMHHFTFQGGRVSRWRAWEDTAALLTAWNA